MPLPEFIEPMRLATGQPFDADDCLFEVKWDGMRTLAFIDAGKVRLISRTGKDWTEQLPEIADALGSLPDGTILDGEVIVFQDGRPDFEQLMARVRFRSRRRIGQSSIASPATFIVFDLLYRNHKSVMATPLLERRQQLQETLALVHGQRVVLSDGIIGRGKALFDEATKRGLEGVVGKKLKSFYRPGIRTNAWIKVKRRSVGCFAIMAFVPTPGGFESLLLAEAEAGTIRYVGRVELGFTSRVRAELAEVLDEWRSERPFVRYRVRGACWLRPGLFAEVAFLQRSSNGMLREAVFQRLVVVDSLLSEMPAVEQMSTSGAHARRESRSAAATMLVHKK